MNHAWQIARSPTASLECRKAQLENCRRCSIEQPFELSALEKSGSRPIVGPIGMDDSLEEKGRSVRDRIGEAKHASTLQTKAEEDELLSS
jgi:hypothetical protein